MDRKAQYVNDRDRCTADAPGGRRGTRAVRGGWYRGVDIRSTVSTHCPRSIEMRPSSFHLAAELVLACLTAACVPVAPAAIAPSPRYVVALTSVERPQQAKERYGPQMLSTVRDSGVTKYSFEDSLVSVVILPAEKEFD